MVYTSAKRGLPGGSPLANILVIIVGAIVLATSFVVGFVALLVLASIVFILASVIGLRLWWLTWRARRASAGSPTAKGAIEGEFVVVTREDRNKQD
ncbi:MAG: hypothetical protein AAF660_04895 [Pseudomonadota bacterium]